MKAPTSRSILPGVIIFLVMGIMLLALSGFLTPITRLVLGPFITAQTWITERYIAIQEFVGGPGDLALLRLKNSELEAEISRLQLQVIELQQQVLEAQVLSTLVDYARSRAENRYMAASVIGYDPNPFMRYVIINRGSDDGLRKGMPVVTNQGLVGHIDSVTSGAARVRLITDPGSNVNIHLQQANVEAMLIGQITGDVRVEMIPQSATVQVGDLIVTSGLGGDYPPNIVIGQVTSVRRRDFDLFQSTGVQPSVNYSELQIVLVITNFQPVDIAPLVPTPVP